MSGVEFAVLIPARLASTRLPNKLLLATTGLPMLIHTCRQAAKAVGQDGVVVCCDDQCLVDVATQHGFAAKLTRSDHQSGTDRIAEVAASMESEIVINVQADEPEIEPEHIRQVGQLLVDNDWADIATLVTPATEAERTDPAAVKAVVAGNGRALYFTRAAAPWDRDAAGPAGHCLRHLGIYAYRRATLLGYADLPTSRLEHTEKLEQLRALEAGIGIATATVEQSQPGVDVQADYDAFVGRWHKAQSEASKEHGVHG